MLLTGPANLGLTFTVEAPMTPVPAVSGPAPCQLGRIGRVGPSEPPDPRTMGTYNP
jgi:hypothetical protein